MVHSHNMATQPSFSNGPVSTHCNIGPTPSATLGFLVMDQRLRHRSVDGREEAVPMESTQEAEESSALLHQHHCQMLEQRALL